MLIMPIVTRKSPYTEGDGLRWAAQPLASDEDLLRSASDASERSIDRLERLGKTIRRLSPCKLQQRDLSTNKEVDPSHERLLMLIVERMYPFAAKSLTSFLGHNVFLTYTRLVDKREDQKKLQTSLNSAAWLESLKEAQLVHLPLSRSESMNLSQSEETETALTDVVANPGASEFEPSSTDVPFMPNAGFQELSNSLDSLEMLEEIGFYESSTAELVGLKLCELCFEPFKTEQFEDRKWWR
jgi:hypothetical protein